MQQSPLIVRLLPSAGQRIAGLLGAACASPIIVAAALCIWLEDRGPVFYSQIRVGQKNKTFRLWKLRSMRTAHGGASLTASGDPRVTGIGKVLRKYKLDELPQLWNVARGEMSFIGPRPEVPEYVDVKDPVWLKVLEHKPGITDIAAVLYRNEEQLLAATACPESYYRETLLPAKLRLDLEYQRRRSLWTDCKLLLLTVGFSFFPDRFEPQAIRRSVLRELNDDRI